MKTKTPVAIKTIDKSVISLKKNGELLEQLLAEELRLLTLLEHPHIVRSLGLCDDEKQYYMIFELLPSGNLAEVLQKIKEKGILFTEADAANLV